MIFLDDSPRGYASEPLHGPALVVGMIGVLFLLSALLCWLLP